MIRWKLAHLLGKTCLHFLSISMITFSSGNPLKKTTAKGSPSGHMRRRVSPDLEKGPRGVNAIERAEWRSRVTLTYTERKTFRRHVI